MSLAGTHWNLSYKSVSSDTPVPNRSRLAGRLVSIELLRYVGPDGPELQTPERSKLPAFSRLYECPSI